MPAEPASRRVLLVLSAFLFVSISPIFATVSASSFTNDLAITSFSIPSDEAAYAKGALMPSLSVTNVGIQEAPLTGDRALTLRLCSGRLSSCVSGPNLETVALSISKLVVGESVTISPQSGFLMFDSGEFTLTASFDETDDSSGDDELTIHFRIEEPFTEIIVKDVTDYSAQILNTNVSYPISATFSKDTWADDANVGWKLWNGSNLVASDSETTSVFSTAPSGTQSIIVNLPNLVPPEEGIFRLEAGLYTSDVNLWNNLLNQTVVIDDSVELSVLSVNPHVGASNYRFGEDSLRVQVENLGNRSVEANVTVALYDDQLLLIDRIIKSFQVSPDNPVDVLFPMWHEGHMNASVSVNHADDVNFSNNHIYVSVNVSKYPIVAAIQTIKTELIYEEGEEIVLLGKSDSMAAAPLQYQWWLNGDPNNVLSTSQRAAFKLDMGDHTVLLVIDDAAGQRAYAEVIVIVQSKTPISFPPYIEGIAITRTLATSNFSINLPELGHSYAGIPPDVTGLRVMSLDIDSIQIDRPNPEMTYIDAELNLSSGILTSGIDRSTLDLYRIQTALNGSYLTTLEDSEFFTVVNESAANIRLIEDHGTYLLVGQMQPPNVSADPLNVLRGANGKMQLTWNPTGEIENDYFGGWTLFRWEYLEEDVANVTWNGTGEFQAVWGNRMVVPHIDPTNSSWDDPVRVESGKCVAYMIAALDRSGRIDWTHHSLATSSSEDLDNSDCGDSTAPKIVVSNLTADWIYHNSSDSYEIQVSWIWPQEASNNTFHIYIMERLVMDVLMLEPCAFDDTIYDRLRTCEGNVTGINLTGEKKSILSGTPGEGALLNLTTIFGLPLYPEHEYVFILTPVDDVGNHNTTVFSENTISISFPDMFWETRDPYVVIEPPPPPPMNSSYLGEVENLSSTPAFQVSAIALSVTVVMNLILVPMVLKSYFVHRRQIKRWKRENSDDYDEDDDEEYDGIESMFT